MYRRSQMADSFHTQPITHTTIPLLFPPPPKQQNPALRAKNPDLYSASEKSTLRHLVQVMLGCGVSYVQTQQQQPHMPYGAFGARV